MTCTIQNLYNSGRFLNVRKKKIFAFTKARFLSVIHDAREFELVINRFLSFFFFLIHSQKFVFHDLLKKNVTMALPSFPLNKEEHEKE